MVARRVLPRVDTGCGHPSGFLFLDTRWAFARRADLYYCPHCQERRIISLNGELIASCQPGGEWVPWER